MAVQRRAQPAAAPAVAVLPFVAGDPAEGSAEHYLAFGMTDALIGELSRIGALKVISQTSVMQYRDARKTLPVIARELGAGTVVEGSVVRERGQVRITVQLIDARSDTHLWTQTYTREPEAALAGQRALAREVAGLIRARLVPAYRPAPPAFRQTTPAAYDAYVKGRYFMQRPHAASFEKAREFFEQAVAADPAFAPAHVELAGYFLLTDALAPAEAMPRARAAAQRALALDDASGAAHAALAFLHYFGDWNWAAAERAFARAIDLDPNDARTRRWHALFLSAMGRQATAAEEVQLAMELDPVSVSAFDAGGAVWADARRFDKVQEVAARIHELDADDPRGFMHLATASLHLQRFAEAVEAAERGVLASGRSPAFLCVLAVAQQRAGSRAWQETLREVEALAARGYVPDVFLGLTHGWLGNQDEAMRHLQRAYERRDSYLVIANVAPLFDPLRGNPQFQDLLRRMDFPDQDPF